MIKSLEGQKLTVVAPAIHHTIQWIRQWAAVSNDPISLAISDDPSVSAAAAQLVRQIVQTIEATEGVPANELSDAQKRRYVQLLSDTLERLTKDQLHTNAERGKSLLKTLREDVR
jgi:hypothetical protein